jgi:hypothetical protein
MDCKRPDNCSYSAYAVIKEMAQNLKHPVSDSNTALEITKMYRHIANHLYNKTVSTEFQGLCTNALESYLSMAV